MKLVVTGAAGFIGANLIEGLNARGLDDIIAVDDDAQGLKAQNLRGLKFAEFITSDHFYPRMARGEFGKLEAVFHEGACSDTMETRRDFIMAKNFDCSRDLLLACQRQGTRLLYASSAAVYGNSRAFTEAPANEAPLNFYGESKLMFDHFLREKLSAAPHSRFAHAPTQVAGFRYFNVYGPREQHKGRMASVAFHQFHQMRREGRVKLFGAYGGYAPGEQRRDFVSVRDVVAVNVWFLDHPEVSGIFNLGTGRAQAFNDVARAVASSLRPHAAPDSLIDYIDFPPALVGKYQSYTQADLSALRQAGCDHAFDDVQTGVSRYMQWLQTQAP
ncbi:MAG: ADP-glyceromanno-heptose 6-epimerase [Brachymonas sp.]|nr:ADP-glyceromanno-heptose 6-epimerase [Brachymonas sp.]